MRIAVCSRNRDWEEYMKSGFRMCEEFLEPIEVDYLKSERQFWLAIGQRRYDLVLVCDNPWHKAGWGGFLNQVDRFEKSVTGNSGKYVWKFGQKTILLTEGEIYYIASIQKAVTVYTSRHSYRISVSMKQAQEQLSDKGFCRIHRNCLVNPAHVKRMEGDKLILENGAELRISSRRKKDVKEWLANRP
ncbi:MAG: LytTR family DNA-binding domain-containing protein [Lachnospiraceae bacterium]|nr:LytTR family DNA-binding domain-containing protein [Lachnospiraceae bacterium]